MDELSILTHPIRADQHKRIVESHLAHGFRHRSGKAFGAAGGSDFDLCTIPFGIARLAPSLSAFSINSGKKPVRYCGP
jgi:hypothetical protein